MSLFQCEVCGCCENTALACQGFKGITECFDWAYAPEREGMRLCSACGPVRFSGNKGNPTPYGKWHGQFDRVFLPLGQFKTNRVGNLEHIETGSEDYRAFAIDAPEGDPLMNHVQEKAGLAKVIDHLKAKGWFPTRVWDGECTIKVTGWASSSEIAEECAVTAEAALHFDRFHPTPEHNHIILVWGSSPEELIADYSQVGSFEQDLDDALASVFPEDE